MEIDFFLAATLFLALTPRLIDSTDEGGIPSQFPVQEETQFLQLLRESLDFFSIEEKFHSQHFLIDYKTRA